MRQEKYRILRHKGWFVVVGERECTYHETRKLALNRIIKELEGRVER